MKFVIRSLLILLALYGLVFAIGDASLSHAGAPLWLALVFAVLFIGLRYLVAPWIVGWLMRIRWDRELPVVNREFIERWCAQRGQLANRTGDKLDPIIETPGGLGEVAEEIMRICRDNIRRARARPAA
jgi:Zn-dependent protease with chaperone function